MDIEKKVSEDIWQAVQQKYEAGLFTDAILETIKEITSIIREKGGVDGDGTSLVGQALGGQSPKVKLNKMESTSEIDEQKGFEQLLRGLYMGIRNPRIHETYDDTKETADAVIIFVDFVYRKIRATKNFFELEDFKKRVFDRFFVEKDDYAELIVGEVPYDELVDMTVSVLQDRSKGDIHKLQYFFRAVFNRADQDQTDIIVRAMSKELRSATSETDMIGIIGLLQGDQWRLVSNDAKIRSENSMIESIKQGKFDIYSGIQSGTLGTYAPMIGEYFTLQKELAAAIIDLLRHNWHTQNYVGEFFLHYLPAIIKDDDQVHECCRNLAYAALYNQAINLRDKLELYFSRLPKNWEDLILEYGLRYKDRDPTYFQKLSDAYLPS